MAEDGQPITLQTESGRTIEVRPPTYVRPNVRKNVSGYYNAQSVDAIDLFIGSEGTLGVIVEIDLKLRKRPDGIFNGIVFFERNQDLLGFVEEAKKLSLERERSADRFLTALSKPLTHNAEFRARAGVLDLPKSSMIDASLLEYFDDHALGFIKEKFPDVPDCAAGAIFFEQETSTRFEDLTFEAWNELLEKHNADIDRSWFGTNEQDSEKMRAFRHALPVSVNERVVRNKQKKIGSDMAVPDDRFEGFLKFQKELLDASGIDYVIFGHIGDCHLHANLLPKNDEEAEKSRHLYGRFIAQAIMLGGCVSAEHGIGKLKRKYLNAMMGERYLNEMAQIKKAFDPNGILGVGNIFDPKYL